MRKTAGVSATGEGVAQEQSSKSKQNKKGFLIIKMH
jgi:hypothetical protein